MAIRLHRLEVPCGSPPTRGRRRLPRRRPARFDPRPERLEARALLSADVWTGGAATSNWSDPANWSLGAPPGPADTANFHNAGANVSSTIDSPFDIAGLSIDGTWHGTITDDSQLSVSAYSQIFGKFVMLPGASFSARAGIANSGDFIMNDGTNFVGDMDNESHLYLSGDGLKMWSGTLTNGGQVSESGGGDLQFAEPAGSDLAGLRNAPQGIYNMSSDGGISEAGGAYIVNQGLLEKSGGTGTSVVTASLDNHGRVLVSSGTLELQGDVRQVSVTDHDITGGVWSIQSTSSIAAALDITSVAYLNSIGSGTTVGLGGPNSLFVGLSSLKENDGTLSLYDGQSFSTAGDFINNGKLTIYQRSTLAVGGGYIQNYGADLDIRVSGVRTSSIPIATGSSGAVLIHGSLEVTWPARVRAGYSFTLIKNLGPASVSGQFSLKSIPRRLKFRVNYHGGDGDDVVITRRG